MYVLVITSIDGENEIEEVFGRFTLLQHAKAAKAKADRAFEDAYGPMSQCHEATVVQIRPGGDLDNYLRRFDEIGFED